jgi:hypothetical protein
MKLYSIMIYRGSPYSGSRFEVTVSLDKGREEKISFPEIPGAAGILNIEGKQVSSCSIRLSGNDGYRLSEIVVLGE